MQQCYDFVKLLDYGFIIRYYAVSYIRQVYYEALFLYSVIRGSRLKRILEIGGLSGYSAKNFLEAVKFDKDGILYTCDISYVPVLSDNHKVIIKNAFDLSIDDVDHLPLDLIFFDSFKQTSQPCFFVSLAARIFLLFLLPLRKPALVLPALV